MPYVQHSYYMYNGEIVTKKGNVFTLRLDLGFGLHYTREFIISREYDDTAYTEVLIGRKGSHHTFITNRQRTAESGFVYTAYPIHTKMWADAESVPYTYRMDVQKVYDGDTVTRGVVDLGFGLDVTEKWRLWGINTPELRGEDKAAGIVSRDYLKGRILNKNVTVETKKTKSTKTKKGKYGRYLAVLHYRNQNINETMVKKGLASEYMRS